MASACSYIDEKMLLIVSTPTRWSKEVPTKINIFSWKLSLDRLPTRVVLDRRGIYFPRLLCPICEGIVESSSRLFFYCSLSDNVNFQVFRW